jgi:ketopantoate reductase
LRSTEWAQSDFAQQQLSTEELGDQPILVSMANGIDNQRVPPKFFSKMIYWVVGYNARRDEPVSVGYQRKGPLLIGTRDNTLSAELRLVQSILSRGCRTEIVDRLQDAVHTKIAINLTNALDALVGRGARPLSDLAVYQQYCLRRCGRECASCTPRAIASTASPAFRRSSCCICSRLFPAG